MIFFFGAAATGACWFCSLMAFLSLVPCLILRHLPECSLFNCCVLVVSCFPLLFLLFFALISFLMHEIYKSFRFTSVGDQMRRDFVAAIARQPSVRLCENSNHIGIELNWIAFVFVRCDYMKSYCILDISFRVGIDFPSRSSLFCFIRFVCTFHH